MREARLPSTRWWPRSARSRPSRWFVSKVCPGSSVSMILDKSKCSSSMGASQRIHFFASRLKYSRFMCVSLVPDEAVESLVRTLAEHLASWGGAPLQCVFDRPKTIALQWRKNGEVNQERACRATGVIPAVRWAEEKSRLRPLKVQPEELALRIPVYVGPTGTVLHEGHAYSMPPEAISMPATLYLYGQRVRIVAGRYEAEHPRKFVAHEGSSLAEHRAALVAAVSGKRGRRYLKRQQLLELGEPAIRYLTEIVHRRPRHWYEDVDRLHAILQSHGPEVLRRAMEAGLQEQVFGAFYVERCLQPGLNFAEAVQ